MAAGTPRNREPIIAGSARSSIAGVLCGRQIPELARLAEESRVLRSAGGSLPEKRVVYEQDHHAAHERDQDAPQVESSYSMPAECTKNNTTDYAADDAKENVPY